MRKAPPEARGSCSAVTEEEAAGSDMDSEFELLLNSYASVTSVTGRALGPLYYVTLTVSGSPVEALVDPGSSACVIFRCFATLKVIDTCVTAFVALQF